jgi:nucleoside-diphosphate-sugar epimerase
MPDAPQQGTAFITGATGYIGHRLAMYLAEQGQQVHILVRNLNSDKVPKHPLIQAFAGDIVDPDSIRSAMQGCTQVYHIAALVRLAHKDPSQFNKVNVEGTRNVLEVALELNIERCIFTSTTGVIGPSLNKPMREQDPRIVGFENSYEITKQIGESLVLKFNKKGLPGIIVSPSRVYGPGPATYSSGVNRFIDGFLNRPFTVVPTCDEVSGNYAFIDDVVHGHALAMRHGKDGERYILGGENVAFGDFINLVRTRAESKSRFIKIPKSVIKIAAFGALFKALVTNQSPDLTPKLVDRLFLHCSFSCDKAIADLGYQITPFDDGIRKTISHLRNGRHA